LRIELAAYSCGGSPGFDIAVSPCSLFTANPRLAEPSSLSSATLVAHVNRREQPAANLSVEFTKWQQAPSPCLLLQVAARVAFS
jgi:hypothetical protein